MIMEEYFCDYRISSMLRDLGMREESTAYFDYKNEFHFDVPAHPSLRSDNGQLTPSYLYSQVEKWLLDKHKIWILVKRFKKSTEVEGKQVFGFDWFVCRDGELIKTPEYGFICGDSLTKITANIEGIKYAAEYLHKQLKQKI